MIISLTQFKIIPALVKNALSQAKLLRELSWQTLLVLSCSKGLDGRKLRVWNSSSGSKTPENMHTHCGKVLRLPWTHYEELLKDRKVKSKFQCINYKQVLVWILTKHKCNQLFISKHKYLLMQISCISSFWQQTWACEKGAIPSQTLAIIIF